MIAAEDRLTRRPGDYERFVEAITYQDGRVFADARGPKDLYSEDTESTGSFFSAVISKMEVRKMQRRMRCSHRTRAEQGLPVGGTRPFGWKPDRLSLDPNEAPLVRQAVLDLIAGSSLHSIAHRRRPRVSEDLAADVENGMVRAGVAITRAPFRRRRRIRRSVRRRTGLRGESRWPRPVVVCGRLGSR